MEIKYQSIGIIRSPFKETDGMPIQSMAAKGIRGEILINDELIEGLEDLPGFSHIVLVYHFHLSKNYKLKTEPFLDDFKRGVFATRAPSRPNPIGFSVVKLISIDGNKLIIENIDIVDGTPLLDIKPYIPEFDNYETSYKIGWLDDKIQKTVYTKSSSGF
jgi:tRNA (adenine37-N6)-methyltransferase